MKRLAVSVAVFLAIGMGPVAAQPSWRLIKAHARFAGRPATIWLDTTSIDGQWSDGTATIQFRPVQVKTISRLTIGLRVNCLTGDISPDYEYAYDRAGKVIPGYWVSYTPQAGVNASVCSWFNEGVADTEPAATVVVSVERWRAPATAWAALVLREGDGPPGMGNDALVSLGMKTCNDVATGVTKRYDVGTVFALLAFTYPAIAANSLSVACGFG